MLFRFSLYGFLKNQRYFEPFLVLAFLEKGLDFFQIGLLIGFRELAVALMETPSGAAADVWGRKRCMILSFASYIGSFAIFGFAMNLAALFAAMFLFAIGDSFRTGTHKAMIFSWLRHENRTHERTRIYGYTRSWSKLGSAASVVLGTIFVLVTAEYHVIFYLAIVAYAIGIINFLGYSDDVDPQRFNRPRGAFRHLRESIRRCYAEVGLRRLVLESMGFEGVFHAVKDYLQPTLQAAGAIYLAHWIATDGLSQPQQTALLVGPVYLAVYLLSAVASRHAHRLVEIARGEERAAFGLWLAATAAFAVIFIAGWFNVFWVLAIGFVALHVLQNFWRPVLVSRIDDQDCERDGATVLSVESQSRRLTTMALAPLLGLAVDFAAKATKGGEFWPIGAAGAAVALGFVSLRFFERLKATAAASSEGSASASKVRLLNEAEF